MSRSILLVLLLVVAPPPAAAGWTLLNHEVNDGNVLFDVSVSSERAACAVGAYKNPSSQNSEPRIMCTADGGRSWSKASLGGTFNFPTAVHLVDDQVGYLASMGFANFNIVIKLYRSENGGRSWTELAVADGVSEPFNDLYFLDAQTGWAAGATVIYTRDGGSSWQAATVPELGERVVNGIHFSDGQNGIAVGGVPATEGDEWTDPVPAHDGFIMRSTDGGASWQMVQEGLAGALVRVVFCDGQGWAVGGGEAGLILHSTDGGLSWSEQTIPAGQYGAADNVAGVACLDGNRAWAVGNIDEGSPMVLYTSDGGASWQEDGDYPHAFDGLSGFDAFAKYSMVLGIDFCPAGRGLVVGKNMIIVAYESGDFCADFDGDGYRDEACGGLDCDDDNPYVNPGAEEACNGLDENCDGVPDDGFDLQRDPRNCGECGFNCQPAQVCWDGSCTGDCPGELDNCSGECVDLQSDPGHCGSCDHACSYPGAEAECRGGDCSMGDCLDGFYDLDGSAENGCEYQCSPSGAEACDGIDNDCDGLVDEDLADCQAPDGGQPDGGGNPDGGSSTEGGDDGERPGNSGCGCQHDRGQRLPWLVLLLLGGLLIHRRH